MYAERRSIVPGAVLWTRVASADAVRVLPDGCIDLIWSADGRLFVAGPDTTAQLYRDEPGRRLIGLRFAPGTAPSILGTPGHVLRDQRPPLESLWPAREVGRLAERVAASPTPGRALEAAMVGRLRGDAEQRRLTEVVALLRAGRDVAVVAEAVGLSERQLLRRSLEAFGYGPKTLARILRFGRAVAFVRRGLPFVDAAIRSGYADQAHLARDVRGFAGTSLTELTR